MSKRHTSHVSARVAIAQAIASVPSCDDVQVCGTECGDLCQFDLQAADAVLAILPNLPADNASTGLVGKSGGSLPVSLGGFSSPEDAGERLSQAPMPVAPLPSAQTPPVIRSRSGCTGQLCCAPLGPHQTCKRPAGHSGQHSTYRPEPVMPHTFDQRPEWIDPNAASAPSIPTERLMPEWLNDPDLTGITIDPSGEVAPNITTDTERAECQCLPSDSRSACPGTQCPNHPAGGEGSTGGVEGGPTPRQPSHVRAREGDWWSNTQPCTMCGMTARYCRCD